MILVEVVIVALVSYRLWRLLAVDDLTERIRHYLFLAEDEGTGRTRVRSGANVLACPWCAGFWCTVAVGVAAHLAGFTDGTPWLVVPAASVIVGFIGEKT